MAAEFEVIDSTALPERDGHGAPFTTSRGPVRSRSHAPAGFDQFVAHGTLGRGAVLEWGSGHGDEGVFVLAGDVRVDGCDVGAKSAVVIEADAATTLEAVSDARILHVGSTIPGPVVASSYGAPDTSTRSVHVHDAETAPVLTYEFPPVEVDGVIHDDVVRTAWFSDGGCPSCRIALFRVWGTGPHRGKSHHHSAHELITVTEGEIQVGRDRVVPGMTLAIPAERRYSFRTAMPWEFVNFRSDVSTMTVNPGDPPVLDGPTFQGRIAS